MFFSVSDPPDAAISAATAEWFVGLEKAELMCSSGGYPKPENVTWKRYRQPASKTEYWLFAPVWSAATINSIQTLRSSFYFYFILYMALECVSKHVQVTYSRRTLNNREACWTHFLSKSQYENCSRRLPKSKLGKEFRGHSHARKRDTRKGRRYILST